MANKKITEDGEVITLAARPQESEEITFKPFLRAPGGYDTDAASRNTAISDFGVSKTIQSQKDETDINLMIKRHGIDGAAALGSIKMPPSLDDFDEVFDFQTAMNTIRRANETFAALHPDVRSRFHNDPHEFLAYVDDLRTAPDTPKRKRGLEELVEMGLAVDLTPPPVGGEDKGATPVATPPAGTPGESPK